MDSEVRDLYQRLIALKDFLQKRHTKEYLTAFLQLKLILEQPVANRSADMLAFWSTYIFKGSANCVDFAVEFNEKFDQSLCSDKVINELMVELYECLQPHIFEFKPASRFFSWHKPKLSTRRTPSEDDCFRYARQFPKEKTFFNKQ